VSGSARPISSGVASFGLVSIPFKVYVATHAEESQFNLLHDRCKGRLKQQYVCPGCGGEVVDRGHTCRGFEYAKDSYVTFTESELKQLESQKTTSLEIVEFVPESAIDLVQIEKSYYLGPDKGSDKAYQLLVLAMTHEHRIAVGRFWTHGKLQLVLLRPYKAGILMHYCYYASEIRAFEGIAPAKATEFTKVEMDLARKLVAQLSSHAFDPNKYRDEYRDRVRAAVDRKVAGLELKVAEDAPTPTITDLFEALKRSLRSDR
jgi:DNA end-binding protein Ku